MKRLSISKLAREFALSRSALLYYDRIGLLSPPGRTGSGYRVYGEREYRRLQRICVYREAGLSLEEIQAVLDSKRQPSAKVLEQRLSRIGGQIRGLRNQQRLLSSMLTSMAGRSLPPTVDKNMFVELLRAAGVSDEAMGRWHTEFEKRSPQAHHDFLLSLGIPESEAVKIRQWSLERGQS